MLPHWLYERQPGLCLLAAGGLITLTGQPLLWCAGILLFVAGAASWILRSRQRRTDLVIWPTSGWLRPAWLYEARPFLWLALGLGLIRLPDPMALLALLPLLWGWRCLRIRRRYRHHVAGRLSHRQGPPRRRRLARILR